MSADAEIRTDCDIAVVGAGLAGGLVALAFAQRRPELRLILIDGADRAGGNHIWSFFDSDLDADERALIEPVIAHRWESGHRVRFPSFTRDLTAPYNSLTSARLDAHLQEIMGDRLRLGDPAVTLSPQQVDLASGARVTAKAVIDARGFGPEWAAGTAGLFCGWQKFVGQTVKLAAPHGLDRPVIMDADVDQIDGYRFVYLLPFSPDTLFIEDTYYSDDPQLDQDMLARRIAEYAVSHGWTIEEIVHGESGVLPVVKRGRFDELWPADDSIARAGVRAGLFHPLTGYSLPIAVRFALMLARLPATDSESLARASRDRAALHWRSGRIYRLLARMLFDAAAPAERRRIFARFYRLPAPLIARFYASTSTAADKIRILCGRPPVPIRAAMRALWNHDPA